MIDDAGDVIDYQIVVTNDGNVDLTGVSVADPLLEGANGTLWAAVESLTADGSWRLARRGPTPVPTRCSSPISMTTVAATATSTTRRRCRLMSSPTRTSSAEQPLDRDPQYSIDKTITGVDTAGNGVIDNAGDVIDYQIVVTNDGNVDLTGVSVADPLLEGANGTLWAAVESLTADGVLEVGETWTYTGTYTVQQSDINDNGGGDGDIDNTATVSSDELRRRGRRRRSSRWFGIRSIRSTRRSRGLTRLATVSSTTLVRSSTIRSW